MCEVPCRATAGREGCEPPQRSRESNEGKVIAHWGSAAASRKRWHLVLALAVGDLDILRGRKVFSGQRELGLGHRQEPGGPFTWLERGYIRGHGVGIVTGGGYAVLGWGAESFRESLTDRVSTGWVCTELAVLVL